MATIRSRKRKSGTQYTARIRRMRDGVVDEAQTFSKRTLAKAWADRREAELGDPSVLAKTMVGGITIGKVLEWYSEDYQDVKAFGRSKLASINQLINRKELSGLDAVELTTAQLVRHALARSKEGASPSTVNNDFIWLRVGFRAARIGRDAPVDQRIVSDAAELCRKEGLISKSKERDRRPSVDEIACLLEFFDDRDGRASLPMRDIVLFAMFSSRRLDEICRIEWADIDEQKQRVLVRNMKHPKQLIDTWVDVPSRAWAVLKRQPEIADRIFPFVSKSASAAFTRSCKFLDIKDLRFHDLRHEAISCLFELSKDISIPNVAKVSGHKAWTSLQGYTQIDFVGDKWAYLLGDELGNPF